MERNVITGIAHDKNEAMVTLFGLPDAAGHGGRGSSGRSPRPGSTST